MDVILQLRDYLAHHGIFRFIRVLCGTDSIPQNILGYSHIVLWENPRILYRILSAPHNIVMDLNDVLTSLSAILSFIDYKSNHLRLVRLVLFSP